MKALGIATLAAAALLLPSCGDDDDEGSGNRPAKTGEGEALFNAREYVGDIEADIAARARREERAAGNDPADYKYDVKCVVKSDVELSCRLDLTNKAGRTINTVGYLADVDPDTGEFGYKVTSNRDTRAQPGS